MTDPYQVLGITPSASDEEVKETYRKLSQQYHPDMQSGNSVMEDIANEKMADINAAYDEIMNQRRSNTGNANPYIEIRSMIERGNYTDADNMLERSRQDSNAEWNFLKGTVCLSRGWLNDAYSYYEKAVRIEPSNREYQAAFNQMKNKFAAMAAQVKELTKEVEKWKNKYQKTKQAYNSVQKELDDMRKDNQKLLEEKNMLQSVSDRYDRVVRVMGIDTVEAAVLQDIHNQKALEEKRRMEQMPKGSIYERLAWGAKKSEMENQQRKKNKTKNRGMEI